MNKADKLMTSYNIEVSLQWIPGHVGLPGNERADKLAKLGAQCPQTATSVTINTAKHLINEHLKNAWIKKWADGKTGRKIFEFMPVPNKNDPINKMRRKEQAVIFRLRSEHIQLNKHLNDIGIKDSAKCPLCPCPEESVAHHLYQCPALDDLRAEFLPSPNPQSTLYGDREQLEQTYMYHIMAKSRRANVQ